MRPINLLPPEAFQRLEARKLRGRLIVIGILYVVLLALVTLLWQGRVDNAESDVAQQEEINAELSRQVSELSEAQTFQADYDSNAALIVQALEIDMSWGRFLNDLARLIPDRVWLNSFTGAVSEPGEAGIGTVTVSGVAFEFPDVSAWLRSMDTDRFPSVTGTWVQTLSSSLVGEADVVDYSSTTGLTEAALSDRVEDRIPEVVP